MGVSGSRSIIIMQLFIIHLFCCLGCLCNFALAQFEMSENFTGSASSSTDIEIAFIGNLAVFVTSLLRGRLDLEMGARDVLATMRGPALYPINKGFGLTTCQDASENRFKEASVVMLSYNKPNSSMTQFMKYICNAYKVHSILLQCFPLKSKSAELLPGLCNCDHGKNQTSKCECIVFWNVEEIVTMLARRMPGTLKQLSDSLCLLPSPECLKTGCHGCNKGQLYVEQIEESGSKIMTEEDTKKGNKAVEDIFEHISGGSMKDHDSCICIPLSPSGYDYWTKLLIRSFGATGDADRVYSTASLIVPRLAEVSLNLLLTGWFKVDGFSSALIARRAIKSYVVDSKGSGFAASAFLMKAMAKKGNDCRVLNFRGTRLGIRTFSYIVGSINLLCSVTWALLVALQGTSVGERYDSQSIRPSKPRVVVIIIAIGIALCMDCLHLYWSRSTDSKELTVKVDSIEDGPSDLEKPAIRFPRFPPKWFRPKFIVFAVIFVEMVCILSGSIVLGILSPNYFGKWVYSVLQVLVWIKWGAGSYLLGEYPPEYDSQYGYDNGILVYASAFMLNSTLAGVRRKWHYTVKLEN